MVGRRKAREKEETRTAAARTFIYIHSCPTLKSQMNRRAKEKKKKKNEKESPDGQRTVFDLSC